MREMLIAVQMEKKYSKAEILQGYLNIAQFGTNVYGVESAARRYFSKSAKDLDPGEAATIAAVTKNPARFDPTVNVKASQEQRDIVLDLMRQENYITQRQYDEYKAKPLDQMLHVQSADAGCQAAGDAAFFCDYVTKQILNSKEFGKSQEERNKLLKEGGLDIYTTMDVNANAAAMESKDVEVIVTGGVITRSNSLVGPIADKVIASLRVNTVFLGTHSVSIPRGFLMPNSLEAATDMALMDIADRTIILTDHTKWSCTSLSLFASFDQVDTVITDDQLDQESAEATRSLVKRLVLVPVNPEEGQAQDGSSGGSGPAAGEADHAG